MIHQRLLAPLACFWVLLALLLPTAAAIAQDEVTVSVKAQREAVLPGDTLAIAVIFDHQPGWKIHTHDPQPPEGIPAEALIATEIEPEAHELVSYRAIQWPESKVELVDLGFGPMDYKVYSGRAIAYVPIEISPDAEPGSSIELAFRIAYQACDETTCLMPEELVKGVVLPVISLADAAERALPTPDPDFEGFDPAVFAVEVEEKEDPQPAAVPGPAATPPDAASHDGIDLGALGLHLNIDPRSALGIIALMIIGFIGGFVLNLTPCVLPVIPIKIMGLQQAAGNPSRCFLLGVIMSAGVLAFWLSIGASIAVLSLMGSTSELFGIWWFTLPLGLFIGVMGLGMMGLFTVQLPQAVYRVNPKHDTPAGSFLFGIMTAVLGLPCFAPFMGAASGVAIAVSPTVALLTFGAIGAGMAFPYLVLSARPHWVNRIPRTGPASELIKQVMGLLLLAFAMYFIGAGLIALVSERPYLARTLHLWALAAVMLFAGGWLALRTFQITTSPVRRAIFSAIALLIAGGGVWAASAMTTIHRVGYDARMAAGEGQADDSSLPLDQRRWVRYTPAVFEEAIEAGHVVVIDFTAEWCINCHVLKATVLSRQPVERAITSGGVVSMTADLTSRGDPGWALLNELGERGIPLLAIFGPGLERPFKSNLYTVEQVVAAIDSARATPEGLAAADEP